MSFCVLSSAFDVLTFVLLLWVLKASVVGFRTGWFLESVLTEVCVLLVIRTRRPFFRSQLGRALLIATMLVVAVTMAIPYTPLAPVLSLAPIPPLTLLALLAVTMGYMLASEFTKRAFFRMGRA